MNGSGHGALLVSVVRFNDRGDVMEGVEDVRKDLNSITVSLYHFEPMLGMKERERERERRRLEDGVGAK